MLDLADGHLRVKIARLAAVADAELLDLVGDFDQSLAAAAAAKEKNTQE